MAIASKTLAGDGRPLSLVQAAPGDSAAALAGALALPAASAVVLLAGGPVPGDTAQPELLLPRLVQLVGRGLLRAAREAGALCIAPAGDQGLAGLLGRALQDAGAGPALLGVALASQVRLPDASPDASPDGSPDAVRNAVQADAPTPPGTGPTTSPARAPLAPGLTHLVLLPGSDPAAALRSRIDLAHTVADGKPVLMVVMGGDVSTPPEVLQAVRRGWPVLVVAGSGGAADALARQWRTGQAEGDDPLMAEILADGRLTCITLGDSVGGRVGEAVETLARQVLRQSGGESVLRQAWRRYCALDQAAVRQQVDFKRLQNGVLALTVAAVLLTIFHTLLGEPPANNAPDPQWLLRKALWLVLVLVPITSTVLIAAANRFKPGKRWVLMRAAAESIKREIYLFRLHAESYSADHKREQQLAKAVEDITRGLAQTEANTTALPVYAGPIPPQSSVSVGDDGLSRLSTDQYVRLRLADQRSWYRGKTVKLETSFKRWQYALLAAGAVGTLLAAIGGPATLWLTLSTALGTAAMAYLAYQQSETTLVSYNQTATDLDNILGWWTALAPEEQAMPEHIAALSSHTEQVLGGEQTGWAQRMTDALEKLRGNDRADTGPADAPAAAPAGDVAVDPAADPAADTAVVVPAVPAGAADPVAAGAAEPETPAAAEPDAANPAAAKPEDPDGPGNGAATAMPGGDDNPAEAAATDPVNPAIPANPANPAKLQ